MTLKRTDSPKSSHDQARCEMKGAHGRLAQPPLLGGAQGSIGQARLQIQMHALSQWDQVCKDSRTCMITRSISRVSSSETRGVATDAARRATLRLRRCLETPLDLMHPPVRKSINLKRIPKLHLRCTPRALISLHNAKQTRSKRIFDNKGQSFTETSVR